MRGKSTRGSIRTRGRGRGAKRKRTAEIKQENEAQSHGKRLKLTDSQTIASLRTRVDHLNIVGERYCVDRQRINTVRECGQDWVEATKLWKQLSSGLSLDEIRSYCEVLRRYFLSVLDAYELDDAVKNVLNNNEELFLNHSELLTWFELASGFFAPYAADEDKKKADRLNYRKLHSVTIPSHNAILCLTMLECLARNIEFRLCADMTTDCLASNGISVLDDPIDRIRTATIDEILNFVTAVIASRNRVHYDEFGFLSMWPKKNENGCCDENGSKKHMISMNSLRHFIKAQYQEDSKSFLRRLDSDPLFAGFVYNILNA